MVSTEKPPSDRIPVCPGETPSFPVIKVQSMVLYIQSIAPRIPSSIIQHPVKSISQSVRKVSFQI